MAVGPLSAIGIGYPDIPGIGNANIPEDMWKYINAQETTAAAIAQQQSVYAQAAQQTNTTTQPVLPPPTTLGQRAREIFLKRMGTIRAELKVVPGDFVTCHVVGDTVYLFYVFSGKEGVVKEGIDLFPSDQLITQFRLVLT